MQRPCDRCGRVYAAKRPQSRFCSDICRRAAGKARKQGRPESIAQVVATVQPATGAVERATREQLTAGGRDATPLGLAAVALAARIDQNSDTGASVAAIVRELRATLAEAMRGVKADDDLVDELAARRDAKFGTA